MLKDLSKLNAELKVLNESVQIALEMRKAWMDAHMKDYAKFQIGEDIYDLTTGFKLGKVTGHIRFHAGDARYDTTMGMYYSYEISSHCADNTSRQTGISFGTLQEYADRVEMKARWARSRLDAEKVK